MPSVYEEECLNCPHVVLSSVSFQPFVITSLKRAIPTHYTSMRSDIKDAKISETSFSTDLSDKSSHYVMMYPRYLLLEKQAA